MENNEGSAPSARSKVKTMAKRGNYDKKTIYSILDSFFVCHIGFHVEGSTFVIPMVYGRKDDKIYFHGGKGSRLQKTLKQGIDICITVTQIDGLVLARSAFHHSINYRSVVAFGRAEEVELNENKLKALKIISNHMLLGRWDDVRIPDEKELNAATVLSFSLSEASSKVRSGPPVDDERDLNLPVWAGTIPLSLLPSTPLPENQQNNNMPVPEYIINYLKNRDFLADD